MVWVRAPPEEKILLLLLSHGFTSKSDNGALCYKFHHRPVIIFRTFALALNEEYLSPDQEHLSLSSGDILAVIPPISGG